MWWFCRGRGQNNILRGHFSFHVWSTTMTHLDLEARKWYKNFLFWILKESRREIRSLQEKLWDLSFGVGNILSVKFDLVRWKCGSLTPDAWMLDIMYLDCLMKMREWILQWECLKRYSLRFLFLHMCYAERILQGH